METNPHPHPVPTLPDAPGWYSWRLKSEEGFTKIFASMVRPGMPLICEIIGQQKVLSEWSLEGVVFGNRMHPTFGAEGETPRTNSIVSDMVTVIGIEEKRVREMFDYIIDPVARMERELATLQNERKGHE